MRGKPALLVAIRLAVAACPSSALGPDGAVLGRHADRLQSGYAPRIQAGAASTPAPPPPGGLSPLHVQGNVLVNGAGQTVELHGVNRAGSDYACSPFTPCPDFESGPLAAFYRRVIAAIRSAGAPQPIWPEGVAQNGVEPPALPRFDDPQTAFTFHFYCSAMQTSSSEESAGDSSPEAAACVPCLSTGNISRTLASTAAALRPSPTTS